MLCSLVTSTKLKLDSGFPGEKTTIYMYIYVCILNDPEKKRKERTMWTREFGSAVPRLRARMPGAPP